jgi:hypothetical protein
MSEYYEQRLKKLGITEQHNKIALLKYDAEAQKNILKEEQIFRKHDKGIEIIVYTLDRELVTINTESSRYKKHWSIIRLEQPKGDMKYQMPKGSGSYPFFPPELIAKYEAKNCIQTLFITEGFFKARKAAMHGMDIIGLASITHLKEKSTGALHSDILKLIKTCDVKRVVWLTDGDAIDISRELKDSNNKDKDLYKRPSQFFSSINTFKQLLDDYEVDKYFMHVDTDNMMSMQSTVGGNAMLREDYKGIDDILVSLPEKAEEIVADAISVSRAGTYFQKFNINIGLSKVRTYFRLDNVNLFYLFHAERRAEIKGKEFVFNGTRYKYDEAKAECQIIVPGDAQKYFRVGDDYYKFVDIPNKYKQLERTFKGRRKGTIVDDHTKDFIKHIAKYEGFCNVPEHVNYQMVINNCFNVYNQLDFQPLEEECDTEDCQTILNFITHIFGQASIHFTHPKTKEKKEYTTYDLALDYMQVLYQRPWEKLPILCLVSKDNNTGKSTLGKLLKQMFGSNAAIVGNQDLAGDFNAHWSTKLLVVCDETKIDKQVVIEKVKSLSTADKIMMNAKGKDHVEIDCFIKFIFITNNEENFINIYEEDIRYWVHKVPNFKEENPDMLSIMIDEIPAFLSYLNKRKLATEKLNRMWFHPTLLRTDALKKVQVNSQPTVVKEITFKVREMFFDFGMDEVHMTLSDINKEFFRDKYEGNYLKKTLEEHLKVDRYHHLDETQKDLFGKPQKVYGPHRYSYPRWDFDLNKKEKVRVDVGGNGRHYIFKREMFLTEEEIKTHYAGEENEWIKQFENNGKVPATATADPLDDLPF